ncbi:SDR family oxidoreductase [Oscillochloris sp. ZM17-4]|uniref:NAD(P)-dependent oxidoreductase n=1 Tax=Oscillochloris sp. ZM17-4 TaxID=2866714 RepID=UPI001C738250|nr:SDR family oxidoreductase [Oscillochloris sp. ZM17-4]MBX0330292.1 SDR family oxidoreductase [Oscillochloris sp. ZM17-4]
MRIVLFGATGGLGGLVLAEALDRGHAVTAVLREPARLAVRHARLAVVAGDVRDHAAVAGLIAGHDAVVSCIGPGLLGGGLDVISAGMASILAGVRASGARRVVAVAAAGILQEDGETLMRDAPGFPPALRAISAEHLRAYELLRASGARWTLACPPTMADGEGTGGYRAERDYLPEGGERIAYADVALFILDELESGAFVGSRVGIAD